MQIETDCRLKFSATVFILKTSKTSLKKIISIFGITYLIAFPLSIPINASNPLNPYTVMKSLAINECSGIAKSNQFEGIYWVHNDSAGGSDLYAINRLGELLAVIPTSIPNTDWEDITTDNAGNLFIGDFGNFNNIRRNLAIHVLQEPDPSTDPSDVAHRSFPFAFPDQKEFPPKRRLFDCEALFWADGSLFLLTKSLGDTYTRLYRFARLIEETVNTPQRIGLFDIGPQVTAADASTDGKSLAVLTTRSIWIFDRPKSGWNYLDGPAQFMKIQAGQCEAISWDGPNSLIVANENRELFSVPIEGFTEY
tara:strand:- start:3212 stop:4138 length:927 start_codon:yes stop_codon:yes gene_type:complete